MPRRSKSSRSPSAERYRLHDIFWLALSPIKPIALKAPNQQTRERLSKAAQNP